jgi:hypothetical protein
MVEVLAPYSRGEVFPMLRALRLNPPLTQQPNVKRNPLVERGFSKVYIDPDYGDLVALAESDPDTLRFVIGKEHYGVASGYGSTHSNISNALRSTFGPRADGYTLILMTATSDPFEESEWTMHPGVPGADENNPARLWEGLDVLPAQVQADMNEFRKIWNSTHERSIARRARRRAERSGEPK